MTYYIYEPQRPPLPHLRQPRRPEEIVQFQWHATRGAATMDRQVAATENWMSDPRNNNGGWGASADFVVGPDYRSDGEVKIVQLGDPFTSYSTWSAGYGADGTHPAARYGIAIEVAQPAGLRNGIYVGDPDAEFEPFRDDVIDACAALARYLNGELVKRGIAPIPTVHLTGWDQSLSRPVPAGHIGHDELANGWKLGKHDPGALFPWDRLLTLIGPVGTETPAPAPPPPPQPAPGGPDLDALREQIGALEGEARGLVALSERMVTEARAVVARAEFLRTQLGG